MEINQQELAEDIALQFLALTAYYVGDAHAHDLKERIESALAGRKPFALKQEKFPVQTQAGLAAGTQDLSESDLFAAAARNVVNSKLRCALPATPRSSLLVKAVHLTILLGAGAFGFQQTERNFRDWSAEMREQARELKEAPREQEKPPASSDSKEAEIRQLEHNADAYEIMAGLSQGMKIMARIGIAGSLALAGIQIVHMQGFKRRKALQQVALACGDSEAEAESLAEKAVQPLGISVETEMVSLREDPKYGHLRYR